eukprot:TRINITY_DN2966_c0_g1_i1.p1 TRINITY_DN2966_c0_g1~~TRINITY_DN2966_c0_g1_i1.p1  ORF type:complete len:148 (+),score=51.09 TRINITY_DN2966_c0_g1_i1:183-626(+)
MSYQHEVRRQSLNSYHPLSEDSPEESILQNCRRPSLREQPSYKDEVARALNRREELSKLKERLSSSRDLLSADPSTKPWMRARVHRLSNSSEPPKEETASYRRRVIKPESPPRKVSDQSNPPLGHYYKARRNTSVCESVSSGGSVEY